MKYLRSYAECAAAFPRDDTVEVDEYAAVRQRCYDCVGSGNVLAIQPSGASMQLSCQPVAMPDKAQKRGGMWAAAIIGVATVAAIYWGQK